MATKLRRPFKAPPLVALFRCVLMLCCLCVYVAGRTDAIRRWLTHLNMSQYMRMFLPLDIDQFVALTEEDLAGTSCLCRSAFCCSYIA